MVFGAFSMYFSMAIYLNSVSAFIGTVILMILAVLYLRLSEEKRLLKDFGSEYAEYRKKVPMIFPFRIFR
jgi:protein-S-isoprenylcysteine O-methyltransferase Ste14